MIEHTLTYDKTILQVENTVPMNTLQIFITNRCNKRCKACFNAQNLGYGDIPISTYKSIVGQNRPHIERVILMGGEPTLHPDLIEMVKFNQEQNLKTTIYTNGFSLRPLEVLEDYNVQFRIGVYGSYHSEKALNEIEKTSLPVTVVYMLRKDNIFEFKETAQMAQERFNCNNFYISSIRDIAITGSFWEDTPDTISMNEYYDIVQEFVSSYDLNMNLHIARRGVIRTDIQTSPPVKRCRFANVFPDGKIIRCPFDISKSIYTDSITFGKSTCNKHNACLLQKIKLKRI
jgi:organic radical activating enzyme